jgi:hypothetical protein
MHLILAKPEKIASNSLAKQLVINSNLACLPSARANICAHTRLAITISSCMRDSWPRFLHACMILGWRLMAQEHLKALVGLLFFILPSPKYHTLEERLFFYFSYYFGSWQITRFAK